jgi:hypothetical protein
VDVCTLVGFGGGQFQHEVEAEVVGAADPVQEVRVAPMMVFSRCWP